MLDAQPQSATASFPSKLCFSALALQLTRKSTEILCILLHVYLNRETCSAQAHTPVTCSVSQQTLPPLVLLSVACGDDTVNSLQILKDCWRLYQDTVKEAKRKYFSKIFSSNSHNPRVLFKSIDSVLNAPQSGCLEASHKLSNDFMCFFIEKVATTRALISSTESDPSVLIPCSAVFNQFEPVSLSYLEDVVGHLRPSGSPNDPVPPQFFKEIFPSIGQAVLTVINSSLISGVVPANFKHAVVQPLLKKPALDHTVLANYRRISKLSFMSKILEKIVHCQLMDFLNENGILEVFQSGFKNFHSTESALLKVFNDILLTCDSGNHVVLVLLDLTAAFDTVDHNILLSRLHHLAGIRGTALKWFRSYLCDRTFSVNFLGYESSSATFQSGVPQGSILGPLLFSLYLQPLGTILRRHGISFHCYADDCQIYLPLKQKEAFSIKPLLACLEDIKSWMSLNFLRCNSSKTEVILFGPSGPCEPPAIDLGPLAEYFKSVVTNLGFKMDSDFKLDSQIRATVKSSFYHLRRLAKIRPILSRPHLETVIHAFISCRLDYCNALYCGVSQHLLSRLQLVQNSAARLLTKTRKREHITPILASLHWLPVYHRVHFKILMFVFKCLNGLAPTYLSELLHPYSPPRSLRSADKLLLEVPRSKRKLRGDRAFSIAAPNLWNNLPQHIREAPSLSTFKTHLKTHFYSLA
uniref:Reverse transcriptase domain-containing protein n=1 Tax=Oreochromis niloticus TaxID=8128 RepID=A0A669DR24_ORENI